MLLHFGLSLPALALVRQQVDLHVTGRELIDELKLLEIMESYV